MNKKTLRIAGWALGLSMAVAGVGVAVGANRKSPVETKATSGSYTLTFTSNKKNDGTGDVLTDDHGTALTVGNFGTYGTYSFTSNKATYYWLCDGCENIADVDSVTDCYPGKDSTLKVGKSKGDGCFALTFVGGDDIGIDSVTITAKGTGTTAKITVDEATDATKIQNLTTSFDTYTFNYEDKVKTLSLTGGAGLSNNNKIAYISEIVVNYSSKATVNVTGVEIDGDSHEVIAGEDLPLTATIAPADATNKTVTWSSSNPSVATVNSSTGVVHGVAAGSAEITVTTEDGSLTDTETVTVNAVIPVSSVALNKTSTSLYVGDNETLTATVSPAGATYKDIEWSSSDETVATVEDGIVTALKAGTATIKATSVSDGTKFGSCVVTVSNHSVTGISLNKSEMSIRKGLTETLTATITPDNATIKTVTWTSSNTDVATVNGSGVVTAKAIGEATITATTTDGGLTATCDVTVTDIVELNKNYLLVCESKNAVLNGISDTSTKYGLLSTYHYYPTTSYYLTVKAGKTSGTYAFAVNGGSNYLSWTSGNSLQTNSEINENSSWNITDDAITNSADGNRKLVFNAGSPRFACYTSSQTAVSLVEVDDNALVGNFIETRMKMDQYDGDNTYNESRCTANWNELESDYEALTAAQKLEFATNDDFEDAFTRFGFWAANNNRTLNPENGALSATVVNHNYINMSDGSDYAIVLASILGGGVLATGGIFLIARRRREE